MNITNQKGITAVELLAVTLLFGLILSLVFAVEGSLLKTWTSYVPYTKQKETVHHVVDMVKQEMHRSSDVAISSDQHTVTFTHFNGEQVSIIQEQDKVMMKISGQSSALVIGENVRVTWRLIGFSPDTLYVKVELADSPIRLYYIETEVSLPYGSSFKGEVSNGI